jgi:hypothetical protein
MSREEFYSKAKELYGNDPMDWVFVCPWCKHKQSMNMLKHSIIQNGGFVESLRYGEITLENIKHLKPSLDQECLSPDCNYASYGLFGGELEVDGRRFLMLADNTTKSRDGKA